MQPGATRLITLAAVAALVAGLAACSTPKPSGVNGTAVTGQGIGQPSPFQGANLSTLSCGSGDLCAAGGTPFESGIPTPVLAFSHTAGAKWSPARSATGAGATITTTACAALRCLAVGLDHELPVLLSISRSSSSRTWSAVDQPAAGTLLSVGCAGSSTCIGLARTSSGTLATLRSNGTAWVALGAPPPDLATPVHLSCTSTTACTAVGTSATGTPVVLITWDAGATWSVGEISKKATVILGAACRTDGTCWAVGRKGTSSLLARSTRRGAPFLKMAPPTGLATANDVSCSGRTCVVVGADGSGVGAAVSYGGATGTLLRLTYAPTPLLAVSCGTALICAGTTAGSLVTMVP